LYPPHRETILQIAIKQKHVAMVEMLLNHGADSNTTNAGEIRRCTMRLFLGAEDIAVVLLDNGATIEAEDNSRVTALARAGYMSTVEVVRVLSERGWKYCEVVCFDVDAKWPEGMQEYSTEGARSMQRHRSQITCQMTISRQ
jgi:Ankyrin repeat